MTSVERVIEYSELPSERLLKSDNEVLKMLPKGWPSSGVISFKNVSLKYSSTSDYVLRNLSFDFLANVSFWFLLKQFDST